MNDRIIQIEDITDFSKEIDQLILNSEIEKVKGKLPKEEIYPLPNNISYTIDL